MPLTIEQIDDEIRRATTLTKEAVEIEEAAKKTFKVMLAFLILGIFFFPCLIVALICFALHHFGKKHLTEMMDEIHRISAVPEIKERIEFLKAKEQAQA